MKSLAIAGTGIAGMACAYYLRDLFEITVYERNDYVGGHTNTVMVDAPDGQRIPIDTGFMVYNDRTYPKLLRLFDELGVEAMDTDMSFGLNDLPHGVELNFSDLNGFFAQRRRLASPSHWGLLSEILRFFKIANARLGESLPPELTLGDFIEREGIKPALVERFLLPMTGAIWSTPADAMLEYPARSLLGFLANHGLLGVGTQFQWKTVRGGSRQYRDKILAAIGPFTRVGNAVTAIERRDDCAIVHDSEGVRRTFDHVIVATHADEALQLLAAPTPAERELLGAFRYNENHVQLHTDTSVMPRNRRAWASWNYRYENTTSGIAASTHYWMNRLQSLPGQEQFFVSVDYEGRVEPGKIRWQTVFHHPRFDTAAIRAQAHLPKLNAHGPISYCGSYFGHGFHEDALASALDVVKSLGRSTRTREDLRLIA